MNHDHDDDEPQDQEELLRTVIGELLNLAAQVAELQVTDEAAEDIYELCDFVAEYYQIERAVAVTTENEDGSITTRFETFVGAQPTEEEGTLATDTRAQRGSIRTKNLPKLRLLDADSPLNLPRRRDTDLDDDDE